MLERLSTTYFNENERIFFMPDTPNIWDFVSVESLHASKDLTALENGRGFVASDSQKNLR
jgi:hypothetical protein